MAFSKPVILACIAISALTMVQLTLTHARSRQDAVLIGPNVLVSRDSPLPHAETEIASNPMNPQNLIGVSMVVMGNYEPAGGIWPLTVRAYYSFDSGNTWNDTSLPQMYEGGDPQVCFTAHGDALITVLATNTNGAMSVYRSSNGGQRWTEGPTLPFDVDHEQVVIDNGPSRYHGRMYVTAVPNASNAHEVAVYRSGDDGHTFQGPVVAYAKRTVSTDNPPPVILGDGTLVIAVRDVPFFAQSKESVQLPFGFVTSRDGGQSFSSRRSIAVQIWPSTSKTVRKYYNGDIDEGTYPMFAVNHSRKYSDRMYVVWTDYRYGQARILISYSSDRGMRWSVPRLIDSQAPRGASQYQPQIAVNNSGIVAVTWFDTRGLPSHSYRNYISISSDGGVTFNLATPVSSEASVPMSPGNLSGSGVYNFIGKVGQIRLTTGFNLRRQGGDYMGLTANGVDFHPFWIDSRNGSAQVYTSTIHIAQAQPQQPTRVRNTDVTRNISLVVDPLRYDSLPHQLIIPIRIKNKMRSPLFPPIYVKVNQLSFDSTDTPSQVGWVLSGPEKKRYKALIANSDNGRIGQGAVFDYSKSLGGFGNLPPGGVTEPVLWRIKVANAALTDPIIKVQVYASMGGATGSSVR